MARVCALTLPVRDLTGSAVCVLEKTANCRSLRADTQKRLTQSSCPVAMILSAPSMTMKLTGAVLMTAHKDTNGAWSGKHASLGAVVSL